MEDMVDLHLIFFTHSAEQVVEAADSGVRQGELVTLRQARASVLSVEDVVLLSVVGYGVSVVGPDDVELHIIFVIRVRAHLHQLGALAIQSRGHILNLKIIQVVLDLDVLRSVAIDVVLPGIVLGSAARVDHHLLHDFVVSKLVQNLSKRLKTYY
jgi:hypothetical protein